MKPRIYILAVFVFLLFVNKNCEAQLHISPRLYNALPDSVRPKSNNNINVKKASQILIWLDDNSKGSKSDVNNLSKSLINILPTLLEREDKIKASFSLSLHMYNTFCNEDSTIKYVQFTISTIGNDSKGYEKELFTSLIIHARLAYATHNQFEKALDEMNAAAMLIDKLKNKQVAANLFIARAPIYGYLYMYNNAINDIDSALSRLNKNSLFYKTQAFPSYSISKAGFFLQKYQDSKDVAYMDSAKHIISILESGQFVKGIFLSFFYDTKAEICFLENDFNRALLFEESSSVIIRDNSDNSRPMRTTIVALKAISLISLGKFKEGLLYLDSMPEAFIIRLLTVEKIKEVAEKNGQYKEGLQIINKRDSLVAEEMVLQNRGIVYSVNQKYRVAEKEKDITQLKQRNRLYVIIAAIILTALFVAFLFYLRFRRLKTARKEAAHIQKLKDLESILLKQELDMRASKDKLISERKHIGRVLHDGLSGSLASLKFLISDYKNQTSNEPDKKKLQMIEKEVASIYQESREYSHRLAQAQDMEATQENFDVLKYIDGIREQFNALGVLKIFVTKSDSWQQLTTAQSRYVFYILKECFSNAVKHAQANNIWISLLKENNDFILQFKDDGIGITENTDNGIGLANLKNYITHLNGKMQTDTMQGVSYTFVFPL